MNMFVFLGFIHRRRPPSIRGRTYVQNDHNAPGRIKSTKIAILGRHQQALGSISNHRKRAHTYHTFLQYPIVKFTEKQTFLKVEELKLRLYE